MKDIIKNLKNDRSIVFLLVVLLIILSSTSLSGIARIVDKNNDDIDISYYVEYEDTSELNYNYASDDMTDFEKELMNIFDSIIPLIVGILVVGIGVLIFLTFIKRMVGIGL